MIASILLLIYFQIIDGEKVLNEGQHLYPFIGWKQWMGNFDSAFLTGPSSCNIACVKEKANIFIPLKPYLSGRRWINKN